LHLAVCISIGFLLFLYFPDSSKSFITSIMLAVFIFGVYFPSLYLYALRKLLILVENKDQK
jgi:hypothetical protein